MQTGQSYDDPLHQLDVRVAKRFGRTAARRVAVMADLYNVFTQQLGVQPEQHARHQLHNLGELAASN